MVFGEVLKKCIDKNGISIYKLSQSSGVGRTYIHKIISQGSVPSEENFNKLLTALAVSPFEKDELVTAYKISKDGEFLYNQRIQVKRLIDKMCAVQEFNAPLKVDIQASERTEAIKEIEVISGEFSVNHAINSVLSHENSLVRFIMPHDFNFFYDNLFLKFCENPALNIECVFEFTKMGNLISENNNINLEIIETLTPFIMKASGNFSAYYLYSLFPAKYASTATTPYLLITTNQVVLVATDLQSAVVFGNADLIAYYSQLFTDMKQKGQALITRIESLTESIAFYKDLSNAEGVSGFGSHPCISIYYDREATKTHLPPDLPNREQMIDMLLIIYEGFQKLTESGHISSYFTYEGFDLFCRKGIIETITERFFRAYTPPERAEVIRKMLTDTENDKMIYRVVNTSNMKIPACFYADIFNGSHMNLIIGTPDSDGEISTLKIAESSIVEAFHDFLVNAVNTEFVYSKSDTLKVLREALKTLELKTP
jgi:transcriptional regulator with XRE-family HTH domain